MQAYLLGKVKIVSTQLYWHTTTSPFFVNSFTQLIVCMASLKGKIGRPIVSVTTPKREPNLIIYTVIPDYSQMLSAPFIPLFAFQALTTVS